MKSEVYTYLSFYPGPYNICDIGIIRLFFAAEIYFVWHLWYSMHSLCLEICLLSSPSLCPFQSYSHLQLLHTYAMSVSIIYNTPLLIKMHYYSYQQVLISHNIPDPSPFYARTYNRLDQKHLYINMTAVNIATIIVSYNPLN